MRVISWVRQSLQCPALGLLPRASVLAVVTQPDRKRGQGQVRYSPVKRKH